MGNLLIKVNFIYPYIQKKMKIIVAGYSKTGTKSLNTALKHLGYSVDDLAEHLTVRTDHWWRIFTAADSRAQTVEIFKEMHENVDACMDTPVYLFWEYILEAFPDAKVILMERDNEEVWWKSLEKHFIRERKNNLGAWVMYYFPRWLVKCLCYDLWKSQQRHYDMNWGGTVGPLVPYGPNQVNRLIATKRYREHNAYVKLKCPKEKLLIWNPKEGWAPLCSFLGHETPKIEYPNVNRGGQIVDDILQKLPRALEQRKQLITRFCILVGLVSWGVNYLYQHLQWV